MFVWLLIVTKIVGPDSPPSPMPALGEGGTAEAELTLETQPGGRGGTSVS